jgi:ferredoxin
MVSLEDLKNEAKRILSEEKVKYIIGYQKGTNGTLSAPVFIKKPEDVDKLIWDPTCIHNLSRFLVDERQKNIREKHPDTKPVGIVVKGCDSRALVVLMQEEFIKRESIYIIGVSCEKTGILDEKKLVEKTNGEKIESVEYGARDTFVIKTKNKKTEIPADELLAERCRECKANFPVLYDIIFGEKVEKKIDNYFKCLEKIESISGEKKWVFWKEKLDKCLRCYACRSICPMCYCDECVVDTINFVVTADTPAKEKAQKIKWIEKSPVSSENFVYHMVRAIHLAGRCIDCSECERVCPVNIPLRLLNKKMEKEAKELFDYEVGLDPEEPSLVSSFKDEDPEDFIR